MKINTRLGLFVLCTFITLGVGMIPFTSARAAADVPCNSTDLIDAIQDAVNAGGAQSLSLAQACTYTLTAVNYGTGTNMATGLPRIENNVELTIAGNNATIQRDPGAPQFRILTIAEAGSLVISAVTIRGGRAADDTDEGFGGPGGGIYNSGTLDISLCSVLENRAGTGSIGHKGGGGGGIFNEGELMVTHCNIHHNVSGDGSDFNYGGNGGDGGGVYNKGTATIRQSAVYGNKTGKGGNASDGNGGRAGHGGGIMTNGGKLVLANSTVSGNKTGRGGDSDSRTAGQGGWGGGIATGKGKVTITNSTIAKNKPGGGGNGKGTNLDGQAGGIWNMNTGQTIVANTIVADNSVGNCSGVVTSNGNNLDTGTSCGFGSGGGSKSNALPNLKKLDDNGGFSLTHAIAKPSDALNKGKNSLCSADPINGQDQRGVARPQGKRCEIGAFEFQAGN